MIAAAPLTNRTIQITESEAAPVFAPSGTALAASVDQGAALRGTILTAFREALH